jgi:hypothetical protein
LRLAYEAKLTSLSVLYAVSDRVGALTAPIISPVPVAGGFVAVLSAQQSASGVLMTGLQTTLAARSQQRSQLGWANRLDLLFVAAGLMAAAAMIVWQEPLVDFLRLDAESELQAYWVPIALLIPASLASRVFEFRCLTTNATKRAVTSRAVATVVVVGASVMALVSLQIGVLAQGLLVAEVASVLTSAVTLVVQNVRTEGGRHRE